MADEIEVGSRWRCAGGPEYEVEVKGVDGTDTFWSRPYVSFVPVAGGAMETYNAGRFRRAFVPCEAPAFIPVAAPAPREVPAHYAGSIEPLACEKCGGGKVEVLAYDLEPSVLCAGCGERGPRCETEREAIFHWNRGRDGMAVKTFESGANRSLDAESTRYDLVSPIGLRRLAETYAEGAAKYGPGNWLKGIPASDLLNHLMRHVDSFRMGDRGEDHLAHAAWGLFALMHFEETRPDMMDQIPFAAERGGAS